MTKKVQTSECFLLRVYTKRSKYDSKKRRMKSKCVWKAHVRI